MELEVGLFRWINADHRDVTGLIRKLAR